LCLGLTISTLKNRCTIRANVVAYSAAVAFLAVYQHSSVFLFLVKSLAGAIADAGWLLAMVAGNPLKMHAYIGKAALLIFIDPQVLQRSWRKTIPILTSDSTSVAPRTSALVEEETVLRHYATPPHFST